MTSSAAAVKAPGETERFDGSPFRIAIVHARWNPKIISALLSGVISALQCSGVLPSNTFVYDVPGSFELPLAVQRASQPKKIGDRLPDAIIAIGVLIKGETMHFEYISEAVTHGLMRVQLDTGIPVVFGVLTALSEEQALARAGLAEGEQGHNHGEDWAYAAIELAAKSSGVVKEYRVHAKIEIPLLGEKGGETCYGRCV